MLHRRSIRQRSSTATRQLFLDKYLFDCVTLLSFYYSLTPIFTIRCRFNASILTGSGIGDVNELALTSPVLLQTTLRALAVPTNYLQYCILVLHAVCIFVVTNSSIVVRTHSNCSRSSTQHDRIGRRIVEQKPFEKPFLFVVSLIVVLSNFFFRRIDRCFTIQSVLQIRNQCRCERVCRRFRLLRIVVH